MIDIAVHNINKYYGSNHVIKGIDFEVYNGEKVGLLGKNGCGKTTLFKVITGEEYFESGNIAIASGKKVGMLAQIPQFGENDTAEDVLRTSFKEVNDIYQAMKKIEGNTDPAVLANYGRLMDEYERLGGYNTEVKLDKICNGMNIDERLRNSLFRTLSGGEQTRINLARILLRDSDILLLDEPTNHLDISSLEWLERFLNDYTGTVVVISHDRIFLDHVVTRIIEIDDGKAEFYAGNYTFYVNEKEQRFMTQAEQYKQQQRKISQLEAAIKRQRVWAQINPSNSSLAKRALAMERRIEQMDKVDRPVKERALSAEFDAEGYAAKVIISFESVCKSYGEKNITCDADMKILRNDRIALVGENGCGKSTLLKMIMNEIEPDSGIIKVSPSTKASYMPQIIEFENNEATILDTLRSAIDETEQRTRSILANFHFRAADVMKKVGSLSGGEKSRLKLCIMIQNKVNLLLLDEPTNHLDIASREWIENALEEFDGTMFFVSHDRYFLNKFASRIWHMENGVITEYNCGFQEYQEIIKAEEAKRVNIRTKPAESKRTGAEAANKNSTHSKDRKQSEKTDKKTDKPVPYEELISETENELHVTETEIEADLQLSDYSRMNILYEKKKQLEERLEKLYEEWADSEK